MESLIPKNLSIEEIVEIENEAKDYALINGIGFRLKNTTSNDELTFSPFTLFPSPFLRKHFDHVKSIQPYVNQLHHSIAFNDKFLLDSLEKVIKVDDFTENLFKIYQTLMKEGFSQEINLGLFRSDYMMHQMNENVEKAEIKQVEMNAIAAGFGGLGPKVSRFHKYILSKYSSIENLDKHLPENQADVLLANGLIKAWQLYGVPSAIILFVVEDRTLNISDQRSIEFEISKHRPDIKVKRRSFNDLNKSSTLSNDKRLIVDGLEVAVVYYRVGYAPKNYSGQQDWKLRLDIERSKAIKSPSIRYHLSGVKKLQQILANKKVLEEFIPDENQMEQVFQTYAGLWGLELNDSNADKIVDSALNNPQGYVLKPQREGGGNNYYANDPDNDIVKKLSQIKNSNEREAFILMELIRQPKIPNYILIPNKSISETNCTPINVVGELGIFGVIMGTKNQIVENYESGHVVRSKMFGVHEGGVAAGFGAVDSPFLVDL